MERVVNIQSIVDSVQVILLLKNIKIRKMFLGHDSLGNPIHWLGGYVIVFHFFSPNGQFAFRCLHSSLLNISDRLNAISSYFKGINLPYFCYFEYSDFGLIADGEKNPTSTLKWIERMKLSDLIIANNTNSSLISWLTKNFIAMCKAMNQHPKKCFNRYASEKMDFFSELVIYLSLFIFSIRLSLISEFDIIQQEQILFYKDDYSSLSSFRSSKGYYNATAKGSECTSLAAILRRYLKYDNIKELKTFKTYEFPNSTIVFRYDVCSKCGRF